MAGQVEVFLDISQGAPLLSRHNPYTYLSVLDVGNLAPLRLIKMPKLSGIR